ncbi:enoyl-CoA hydratase/isomerase family protein [Congregibacter litoralis]|uniref:Enoyl-CoA hydratase/carnithine racemase n=1 Tax=Congregibacter litoralis KT71 TaxID=314285 RepID=A4A6C0_9GAMM|nr:enoyl-CoA hydratase/isomerase family protein [Congregibacter litoralis]EAQ98567.1 Enoyl-CoA hydratase/carnithine racemase [Congregibacter litoralis KT71]
MMNSGSESLVSCQVDAQGIARVCLNRPEKHNAFDDGMIALMQSHFSHLAERDDVRAVILEAEGKSFSAGADLAYMKRMAEFDYGHNLDDARALATMLQTLKTLPQPTIAKVQGNAFGGAVGLISCCDIAIASDRALFGLTETRIGLIPATIGPHVIEAMGPRWARRLFLTAERFDAHRARDIQLIHECCDVDELDSTVDDIVKALLSNGPLAMGAAKVLVRDLTGKAVDAHLIDDTSARIAHLRVSEEGQEGLQAFLQKRPANWTPGSKH